MAKSKQLKATKLLAPTQTAPAAPAPTSLTLTSADMKDPYIQEWVSCKKVESDAAKILAYAGSPRGRTFATIHDLVAHIELKGVLPSRVVPGRKFSHMPRLTDVQRAQVFTLAKTSLAVGGIAAHVGSSRVHVRNFLTQFNLRPVQPKGPKLTESQQEQLRLLGRSDKPVRAISSEVACGYEQAKWFYRQNPR